MVFLLVCFMLFGLYVLCIGLTEKNFGYIFFGLISTLSVYGGIDDEFYSIGAFLGIIGLIGYIGVANYKNEEKEIEKRQQEDAQNIIDADFSNKEYLLKNYDTENDLSQNSITEPIKKGNITLTSMTSKFYENIMNNKLKGYIILDIACEGDIWNKDTISYVEMAKVLNKKIIVNKKIEFKLEDIENIEEKNLNENKFYEKIFDFFDGEFECYSIIIETKRKAEILKELLESCCISGKIKYVCLEELLKNIQKNIKNEYVTEYDLESSDYREFFIRLCLMYNIGINEKYIENGNKSKVELQFALLNSMIEEKEKQELKEVFSKYEKYIYAYVKKMFWKSNKYNLNQVNKIGLSTYSNEKIIEYNDYSGYHHLFYFKVENGQKYIKKYLGDEYWFDTIQELDDIIINNFLLDNVFSNNYGNEYGKKINIDILELDDFLNGSIKKEIEEFQNVKYIREEKHNREWLFKRKDYKDPSKLWRMFWYSSFKDGHEYWLKGESCRKKKMYKEAIEQYDKARHCHYEQINLYNSYADAYRSLNDYDNEICILEEAIDIVKGNVDNLKERKIEALKLADKHKRLEEEKIKIEEEKIRLKQKQIKEEEKKKFDKLGKEVVLKIIKNPNACLIYRDIIKENEKINKIIDKLELKDNFEKLLWLTLIRIYENKNMPDRNERCYNINCYKDTNILKDKYINEYILNYFSKNKQNKDYYEVFEKKEKELDKEMKNKKLSSYARSTSVLYYVEFFAKVIFRCIELINVVEIFDNDEELDKMYKNLITVTDDVKYITEKIYPIYKKCYESKVNTKITKADLEIVVYLKRKLTDSINIKITQKDKKQALIETIVANYGKILKKEENKFVYSLINLINYQGKVTKEYIEILKNVDELIEEINEKIALNEAEQEKERILSGDLRKEVTLNRLKMTYASVTSPAEFEQYVADLYERLGYTIDEVVDKNKRGGADIIAFKDDIKYVIQVKYYTKPVNKNGIIEVVAAKKLYKANKGIHVTNSYYSMSAMQFAVQNNIELVDGEMIEEYIKEISQKNNK